MSDNVLAHLREKRTRATAPTREDSLVPKPEVIATSASLPIETVDKLALERDDPTIEKLHLQLELAPETVRHSAIVLEKEIDRQLTNFCREHKITVELFLEAAWCLAKATPDYQAQILADAKQRYALRKQVGRARRLLTTLQKLKS